MPRIIARAVLALPLLTLPLASCDRASTTANQQKPPPPQVTVAQPLQRMVTQQDEQVGRFVAVDSVEVRARVSGYLEQIQFRDGEMVEKGQRLFVIDRRPYEITLDQAKANLAQAEANQAFAEADLARAKDLIVGSTITKQTLDQRTATKRASEATVLAQSAAVRQAALDLEFTEVKSPVKGRIGDRRVSVGNFVSAANIANQTLLATIQSIDPIRFEFSLDEQAYLRFERGGGDKYEGLEVQLKLIDEPDFKHTAKLDFVDNAISRTSGTIRLRAVIPNASGLFAPGMFARVRIPVGKPATALLVPDAAVGTEQVRKFVYVVGDDNVAKPKIVKLGGISEGLRVIEDGLAPTDRVVIDGLMRVRPGTPVTPTPGAIQTASGGRSTTASE
ncbi:MAG: efflux RND transporter periplasmic adaptor subunit [Proteobacteria bacterium]|nr:efflux RND transporter periplasmic adaptor subunit [Pseudomonadota bacterium]